MGFLGGLGNFIGTAGPIAANIGGDYEQAQAQGSGQRNQQALQMLMLQRQQRQQEIENVYKQSETARANAQVGDIASQQDLRGLQGKELQYKIDHPTLDPNAPDVLAQKQQLGITENRQKIKDENQYGYHAPVASYEATSVTDPTTGLVNVGTLNRFSGKVNNTGVEGKQPPVKATKPSDVATFAASSLDAMQKAHNNLTQFGGTVATHGQLGNWITGHNPLDNTLQQANQAGEAWVSFATPIMYRGRTTKVEADMIRSSQVPLVTDNPQTIATKQAAREAVIAKARTMAGGGQGASSAPSGGTSLPPLSARDQAMAKQDQDFAAHLTQQGYAQGRDF